MKTVLIRFGLLTLLALSSFAAHLFDWLSFWAWTTVCSGLFALVAVFLLYRPLLFVATSVLLWTVGFPLLVLSAIDQHTYGGSLAPAVSRVLASVLSEPGVKGLAPFMVACVVAAAGPRWMGPNKSFKPNPLRGSA